MRPALKEGFRKKRKEVEGEKKVEEVEMKSRNRLMPLLQGCEGGFRSQSSHVIGPQDVPRAHSTCGTITAPSPDS
jgi:hypothetical protein